MGRLFLSVYLKLVLGLAVALALAQLFVLPRVTRRLEQNFQQLMTSSIQLLVADLSAAQQQGRPLAEELARVQRTTSVPLALRSLPELELDADARARLLRGEVVAVSLMPPGRSLLLRRMAGTDQVLALGPLGLVHPMAGGRWIVLVLLFSGGLTLGVYLLVRPIQRRLSVLGRAATDFGRGKLGSRVAPGPPDAIGVLATNFNGMAEQIQQLIGAQQHLLRSVSHELRTPLQRLHLSLDQVVLSGDEATRERARERCEKDLDELNQLVEELLTYARLRDPHVASQQATDLPELIEELAEELAPLGGKVALEVGPDAGPLRVPCDRRLVRRALSNLITNAFRYARARVVIRAAARDSELQIDVDDDGHGVPESERERIFMPFVRLAGSDEESQGSRPRGFGLGLAIARQIAVAHQGRLAAMASDLGGARFRLSLPMTQAF